MRKIGFTNGFKAIKTLQKAAADPRVKEIEGEAMDEGRVFIHLHDGYQFGAGYDCCSKSVGSVEDVRYAMSIIEKQ